MDNPDELFYLVDTNDNVLGSIRRGEAHGAPFSMHRAIFVLVTNPQNQMLFAERSLQKEYHPGSWGIACTGHVRFGQSYLQAAEKATADKLGIHPHLYYVTNMVIATERETERCQIYLCRIDQTPTHYDKSEVTALTWVPVDGIIGFTASHPLPPADREVLQTLLYLTV